MSSRLPGRLGRLPIRFHELALLIAIVVVVILTNWLDSNHSYWNDPGESVRNIARETAMLGIFSLGAAVVIIVGGIDLSAGSMIAFSGTICGTLMVLMAPKEMANTAPLSTHVIVLAIVGTLFVGFLVGTLHAWLIAILKLPPFIVTLGTLVGLRSLARVICAQVTDTMLHARNNQIVITDERFRHLAVQVRNPIIIFLVLAVALSVLLSRTVVGRHIYALGGNEQAAKLSGIRTERVKWLAYCIGSMTAAIAGILYIGDQAVVSPANLGVSYELNAIAAAVVGGCSLVGGAGTILGTVLGVLFLQVVIYGVGMVIHEDADMYQGLVVGLVLVCTSAFSQFRQVAAPNQRVFPGPIGAFAVLALALLAGTLTSLFANQTAAISTTLGTLAVLAALKIWEGRQGQGARGEQNCR
ncbi:MAG TPA: ABC transporter permease [Pirellulales bacterium]|jgi:ribose/xylose/arabinose/galactoside ABC-type transport system permease subunit|nr:ABC transporter permease [Pirellulales bacterium]